MRLAAITLGLCLVIPALADARPITFGAGVGRVEAELDLDGESESAIQLFGRVGLTSRLAAQLKLQRIDLETNLAMRTVTALLVVELGRAGNFVPLLVAGFGYDRVSNDWYEAEGTHKEGGLGLEYRAEGGLTIGADVRLGGRSIESDVYTILPAETATFAPIDVQSGEYRSARAYVGVRF